MRMLEDYWKLRKTIGKWIFRFYLAVAVVYGVWLLTTNCIFLNEKYANRGECTADCISQSFIYWTVNLAESIQNRLERRLNWLQKGSENLKPSND